MRELESLCKQAVEIVKETGDYIRQQVGQVSGGAIEEKSLNSLVSYVDRTAEEMLVSKLGALVPEATFLTEEDTVENQSGDQQWIIDPLDGTTNFLHQIPCFSVSVALQRKEQTVLGIVYEVNQQECFYAWKDGGAFLDGRPISVSRTERFNDALLATGFPYNDFTWIAPYFEVLKEIIPGSRGIRRIGSAAVDLVYTACGRFDLFFEYQLNPWDVAAGALIVEEAGGRVTDFSGGNNYLHGREIIAGNPRVFNQVQSILARRFHPEPR